MALERKPPFKIQIFKKAQDKHPTRVETRKKESEAQTLAKTTIRRRAAGRVIIIDGNGDVCWNSAYASSMPIDYPKW